MKDIVKWFSNKKSSGYIETKDNGDILVYYRDSLGKYIKFEFIKTNEGYNFKN